MSAEPWAVASANVDEPASIDHFYALNVDLTDSTDSIAEVRIALPFRVPGISSIRIRTRDQSSRLRAVSSRIAKRGFDIVAASSVLLLMMPIMVVIAIGIKATSRGPVIYRHRRVGRSGRPFFVWKFRSMRTDLTLDDIAGHIEQDDEKAESPVYKSPNDPRITSVGRLIRRTALDELPQLLNVVMGSMSLVGPRPLVDEEIDALTPYQALERQSVSPGITGLWQVLRRSEMSFDERVELDLLYVNSRRLWLDLWLIAITPMALLRGERSY